MYSILFSLAQPYTLLLVGMACLLLWGWRQKNSKCRKRWLIIASALLGMIWVLSTPMVAYFMLGALEWPYHKLQQWPSNCQTIVVLGGGISPTTNEPFSSYLSETTLHRCLEAARLSRQYEQPRILVSGGHLLNQPQGPTMALAMRDFLVELGVAKNRIDLEGKSTNTFENSREATRLLKESQLSSMVLVTDAVHMSRATHCFEHFGMQVTPAACHFLASQRPSTLTGFIPQPIALTHSHYAIHEWLGRLWYWILGRI